MCGIIGYIGTKNVVEVLIDSLKRLEYRGYDSAGIAVVRGRELMIRRAAGKLKNLEESVRENPLNGTFGIGHTRWATHGRPTEENAHPHRDCNGRIVVVHNGIIENYLELKESLQAEKHKFVTETDTEALVHLIEKHYQGNLESAVMRAFRLVEGVYSCAVLSADEPDKIVAVRNGPPLVAGLGRGEYFVSSDIPAILHHTREIIFLNNHELATVTLNGVALSDFEGKPLNRSPQTINWDPMMAEKGGFRHYMLKEIFEQPWAIRETILERFSLESGKIYFDGLAELQEQLSKT
ncbi:MAG TPA: class II glutamine amidotransferase, partial [Acidobacteriota bacterium]